MPRPPRQKLRLDFDSIQSHMQEVYNQLEELRQKAVRDYNKVQDMLLNPTDLVTLEQSRNNAMKALDNFFQKKIELVNVHLKIIQAQQKGTATDTVEQGGGGISSADMQFMMAELKKLDVEGLK
jgi:hypothetical protein